MGMTVREGTDVPGTGASTVRIPSADRVDTILEVSASGGSLEENRKEQEVVVIMNPVSGVHHPRPLQLSQHTCISW